jgi:nucleoside-diphosphate-sugar epimerase
MSEHKDGVSMSVMITGGTGYFGAKLARTLVQRGERVVCFDQQPSTAKVATLGDGVRVIRGDVTQISDLVACMREHEVDRIVHLAYIKTAQAERAPHLSTRVNVLGTDNVFEAARLMGVSRVVLASSVGVYGMQSSYGDRPVTEEDEPHPVSSYGAMKWLNEFMGRRYSALYGLQVVALRVSFSYGHGREHGLSNWLQDFASLPAVGKPAKLDCSADQMYNFVYVDDVVDAFAGLCLAKQLRHTVYLSGGETTNAGALATTVREIIKDADISLSELPQYSAHQYIYRVDAGRIQEELGFKARSLREGVLAHINEVRGMAGLDPLGNR